MKQIIIFGSSRSFGYTRKIVDKLMENTDIDFVNLNDLNISSFDYEHGNVTDDFIPLMEKVVTYNTIVIATPVYWYAASTRHKIFFDRLTDIVTIRKDLGKRLRDRKLFVVASFESSYPKGFEDVFEQMCDYLNMEYLGCSFIYSGQKNAEFVQNNRLQLERARDVLQIRV